MTDAPAEFTFECDLDAPPEKVWRALAEPHLRAAWLGEGAACEAIEIDPENRRLTLLWSLDEPPSMVTFVVCDGTAGGAGLKIIHRPSARLCDVVTLEPRRAVAWPGGWRMAA
ncbi:MAG: SRPBCC family protein [Caulobacteraceae bacterium]